MSVTNNPNEAITYEKLQELATAHNFGRLVGYQRYDIEHYHGKPNTWLHLEVANDGQAWHGKFTALDQHQNRWVFLLAGPFANSIMSTAFAIYHVDSKFWKHLGRKGLE